MEKENEHKEYIQISKTTLKKVGGIFFCIYILIFSGFMLFTQLKQSTKIDNIESTLNNLLSGEQTEETNTLQISAMTYYKDYELTNPSTIEDLKKEGDFMIYFHSDTCQYCLEANVFLNQYITLGYQNNTPIYFATIDKVEELFDDDRFQVESTPTMTYYSKNNDVFTSYVGTDDIFTLLDELVKNSK